MNPLVQNLFRSAIALHQAGRLDEAGTYYARALALAPDDLDLLSYCAILKANKRQWPEVLDLLDRAVMAAPADPMARFRRGNALVELGRFEEALKSFAEATTLKPDFAEARAYRGHYLFKLGRAEDALAELERAAKDAPNDALILAERFSLKTHVCAWNNLGAEAGDLLLRARRGEPVTPFVTLFAGDDPEAQLAAARTQARAAAHGAVMPVRHVPGPRERLKIAYLSPDFRDHTIAHQIAAVMEAHDPGRVETYGVSLQPSPPSAIRDRLGKAFHHTIDASPLGDVDVARALAGLKIDIAIDLAGYTEGARNAIFACRPAPIAAAWLGYSGSTGAPGIDYIIADKRVIPPGSERFYSECVVHLPHTFFPAERRAPAAVPSRTSQGLPEDGVVFAAFNHPNKLTPAVFAVWMRLLENVPGSVLWLSIAAPETRARLLGEAERQGIAADRLVFAARTSQRDDHLARLRLADLFLDTTPYGGHSTGSDMLAQGVPAVTVAGRGFAARVAASLLTAAGLPDLIVPDLAAYEALALDLAANPARLAEVKARLAANRVASALFQPGKIAGALETAYRMMWDRFAAGAPPAAFAVPGE